MAHHGLQVPFEPAQPMAAYASRAMWNSASGEPESIFTSCSRQNCAVATPVSRQAATAAISFEVRMGPLILPLHPENRDRLLFPPRVFATRGAARWKK